MKTMFFLVLFALFSITLYSQTHSKEIQVLPYAINNWYPKYSFNYGGRFSTDILKMKGISGGVNISYKYGIKPKMKIIGGLGYYKYSFNKLDRVNSVFGPSDSRPIEYPSMINFFYHTYKYFYNCLSINLGIEKQFIINKKLQFITGLNVSNFLTFSQAYKLNYDNIIYHTKKGNWFAQAISLNIGVEKNLGRLKITPQLIVPIFDIWHKDEVFLEDRSEKRNKWLNGIGLGMQINYSLSKK